MNSQRPYHVQQLKPTESRSGSMEQWETDVTKKLVTPFMCRAFIATLPIFQKLIAPDSMFCVTDREKYLFYTPGKLVDAKVIVGAILKDGDGILECMKSGEMVSVTVPKEVFGVSFEAITYPLKDPSGNVVGSLGIGASLENKHALQKVAQTISQAIEDITVTTEEVAGTAYNLAEGMNVLQTGGSTVLQELKQTDDILKFVSDVAGNSNLLGLNAAIEAARAGEQGRGFAVVAEEIRKMAVNSSQSVKDIKRILNNIQTEISKMITTINSTVELSERQAAATEEVATSMQQLTVSAHNIDKVAASI